MSETEIKPFDNYEISPCTRTEEPGRPGHFSFEVCEPAEADVWTIYGHIPGEGVQAIADFVTEAEAEELYQRITGEPFGSHKQVGDRLKLMHDAPRLVAAIESILAIEAHRTEGCNIGNAASLNELLRDIAGTARSAIAQATGRAA